MGITLSYGNPGDDHGAQWMMAHPIDPGDGNQPPAQLTVSNFTKLLDYQIGQVQENGAATYKYFKPYYQYSVTVPNTGDSGVFFNIQGGGNA